MLVFYCSRNISIFLVSVFRKSVEQIYIYIGVTFTQEVLSMIQESTYIFVIVDSFPYLSSGKNYYLMVVIRTRIIPIRNTVFIFRIRCPITNFKLVHYWRIVSVPNFSRKCLFVIYFRISVISRNNQYFQSILVCSYQPFQKITMIYNYQQQITLQSHLSRFWVIKKGVFNSILQIS